MARSDRAFIFVDNHDNQRGHGGGGMRSILDKQYLFYDFFFLRCYYFSFLGGILTYKDGRDYRQAQAYTLAQDYGE